ncbi:hypothetical protein Pcinc_030639 [Petrolisthes cinctipes]|uniref:DUF4817 domain-containing protein n=1 Tax=Petrolisthes cinctipes TaxID=88211 RepID=A0AAE1EYX2_PETCI|nr:hypothetical protein Pcinc_030639 [Petrolisthes cinctipes]
MSCDIKAQVIAAIKESGQFSLQLDESTDLSDDAQLMTYVRYQGPEDMEEEFLFCRPLQTTTTGEDIFMIGSIFQTRRAHWRHYRARDAPSDSVIRTLINRFEEQGAVSDRPRSGRPRTVRTDEIREQVQESIEENPGTSVKTARDFTNFAAKGSQKLDLFPYKVQLVQQLKPKDYQQRLQYAVRIQELARNYRNFTQNLMMTDEAHFHLNGFISKQNCRFWGSENPRSVHQQELHPV